MSAALGQGIPQRMTAFVDPQTGLITPSWYYYLRNLWSRSGGADAPASIDDLAGEAGATFLGGDPPIDPGLSDYLARVDGIAEPAQDGVDGFGALLDVADVATPDDGSGALLSMLDPFDPPRDVPLYSISNGIASAATITTFLPGIPTAAKGGNARGVAALDIQVSRALATQVASGTGALAFGASNTASGSTAVTLGDSNTVAAANSTAVGFNNSITTGSNANVFGNTNTVGNGSTAAQSTVVGYLNSVTGQNSFVGGSTHITSGDQVIVLGYEAADRGNKGAMVRSTVALGTTGTKYGRSQIEEYTLVQTTAGAVAVRLTTDGAAAGAANVAAVGTSFAASFTAEIVITDTTTNKSVTYSLGQSLIERQTTAASTTITLNAGGIVAGPASAAPFTLAAAPTITADTTNAGFNVSYTPPAANTDTFYAICFLRLIVLRYN